MDIDPVDDVVGLARRRGAPRGQTSTRDQVNRLATRLAPDDSVLLPQPVSTHLGPIMSRSLSSASLRLRNLIQKASTFIRANKQWEEDAFQNLVDAYNLLDTLRSATVDVDDVEPGLRQADRLMTRFENDRGVHALSLLSSAWKRWQRIENDTKRLHQVVLDVERIFNQRKGEPIEEMVNAMDELANREAHTIRAYDAVLKMTDELNAVVQPHRI